MNKLTLSKGELDKIHQDLATSHKFNYILTHIQVSLYKMDLNTKISIAYFPLKTEKWPFDKYIEVVIKVLNRTVAAMKISENVHSEW